MRTRGGGKAYYSTFNAVAMKLVPYFCFLLLFCSCQPEPYNEHVLLHLKGEVKEMITKRYRAKQEAGKLIKGRLVSRQIDRAKYYEYEGVPTHSKVVFDEEKNMKEVHIFDRDGELRVRSVMEDTLFRIYDAQDKPIGRIVMDDRLYAKNIAVYDLQDNVMQSSVINYTNPSTFDRVWKEYNAKEELLYTLVYEYDAANGTDYIQTIVDTEHYKGSLRSGSERIYYDENHHPKRVEIEEGSHSKTIHISYDLDEVGNWVRAVEAIDGEPQRIVERELVYY